MDLQPGDLLKKIAMTPQPQSAVPACPALHSPPYLRGHSKLRAEYRPPYPRGHSKLRAEYPLPPHEQPNLEEKPSSQMFSMVPPLHRNPAPHLNQPSLAQLLEHCSMPGKELKSYPGFS